MEAQPAPFPASEFEHTPRSLLSFPLTVPVAINPRLKVAAVRCVVREHLTNRPIEVLGVRAAEAVRLDVFVRICSSELNREIDVRPPNFLIVSSLR